MQIHEDYVLLGKNTLTVRQIAAHLQVSERTIYEWLRDGKLPGRKIGKVWRLSAKVLDDFLRGSPVDAKTLSASEQ